MVSRHVLDGASSSRHPDWPSLFEKDVRKDPRFLDLDFVGLQSWDPLASYASHAPSAKHIPGKATYPSQLSAPENQRSDVSNAAGPSSTTRRLCTALQVPPAAGFGISSRGRQPEVRNPTGAPLFDQRSVASRSLLSPIDLESPSDQDLPEIGNRDSEIYVSSPYRNGEFQINGRLIHAISKSPIAAYDDPQAYSKALDCTEKTPRPSAPQNGKPATPSLNGKTHSPQPTNFQLERLHREMQEFLVQKQRTPAAESNRFGGNPVTAVEGDPFVSGSCSRSTHVERELNRRAHQASSTYFPPCRGTSESTIKIMEQSGRVEEAHYTTVTSPSRPQIVTISRRGSSVCPVSHVDRRQPSPQPKRDCHPITPPDGPNTTPKTSRRIDNAYEREEIKRFAEVAKANPRPPITPPNSPVETGAASSSKIACLDFVPRDSRRATCSMKRYPPVTWILDELEFLVGNFPLTRLQLDSPAIQHIRREIVTATRSASTASQPSLHSLPHSRYSIHHRDSAFRSFSSHSFGHSCAEGFHGAAVCGLCPPSFGPPYLIPPFASTPPRRTTLYALRKVFPYALSHTLECVQATAFALAYVSSLCIAHNVPSSAPPTLIHGYYAATPTRQEKPSQTAHSDPPRSGTSWLRPQTPEYLNVEIPAERLESLTVSLNELFRKLLTEIDGSQSSARHDALARAVQELIRLGEMEGDRDGVGAGVGAEGKDGGGRRGTWEGRLERRCDWTSPHEWIAR